jgi:hypothetical protein
MRLFLALIAAPIILALNAPAGPAAAADCAIGDAAICAARPGCHWDYNARGCQEGEAARQDACAAHGSEEICQADATLGCSWNAEKQACQSKAN